MKIFDVIGDLHGHAEALVGILKHRGYRNSRGFWEHPDRVMVFVGDLCDRGPMQLELFDIVRRMLDNGAGHAVMGNHEFNAIGFATSRPAAPGQFLRDRSESNLHHHHAFLEAVGLDSPMHNDIVSWFKTLPLWLDFGGFRVVHACWHDKSMAVLAPYLDQRNRLKESDLHALFEVGTPQFKAAEIILKGMEVVLPDGFRYRDANGTYRNRARVRWWDRGATSYRDAVIVERHLLEQLPDDPIPADTRIDMDANTPMFFGHYWMEGNPKLISETMACLDFSVAGQGFVASYAWSGESALVSGNLVWATPSGEICDTGEREQYLLR